MSSKSRTANMERVAFELGMEFSPKDEWGLRRLLLDFKLFRQGSGQRITNLLQKEDDLMESKTYIFDYQYTISTGKSSHTYHQTVFFLDSKKLGLPEFWMKPENFFHKIGDWLGFKDIDFAAFPEFSKQYHLKGKDEEAVRYAMNDQVLHYFTVEKDWCLEGQNYFMIFYKSETLLSEGQIKSFYKKGMELYGMLALEG